MKEVIIMTRTIKLYQAKALINQHNIGNYVYVDYVPNDSGHDLFSKTIFKEADNNQLYMLYWEKDIYSNDIYVKTVNGSMVNIYKYSNTDNCLVRVYPIIAKKIPVTSYEYVRDDYND